MITPVSHQFPRVRPQRYSSFWIVGKRSNALLHFTALPHEGHPVFDYRVAPHRPRQFIRLLCLLLLWFHRGDRCDFFYATANVLDAHWSTKVYADVLAPISLVLSRHCLDLVNDERQRATPTAVDAVYLGTRGSDVTSLGLWIRIAVVDGCAEVDQARTPQKAFLDVITGVGKPLICKLWGDRDDGFRLESCPHDSTRLHGYRHLRYSTLIIRTFRRCLWHSLLRSVALREPYRLRNGCGSDAEMFVSGPRWYWNLPFVVLVCDDTFFLPRGLF